MAKKPIVRIATRKSRLALWQANYVRESLLTYYPHYAFELLPLTTQGDRILDTPLNKIGGKGLFIKELEAALLTHDADIAVHSMKDMPAKLPEDFVLAAICQRDDPRDAFICPAQQHIAQLNTGARIGTSSLRRQCQLRANYPHLNFSDLRGNLETRLAKLDSGEYDAIILATVGLKRLGLSQRIRYSFSVEESLPAAGQGAIGIECLADNSWVRTLLQPLNHQETALCLQAERAMQGYLNANCQLPIGCFATIERDKLRLTALVGKPDGSVIIREWHEGRRQDPEQIAYILTQKLLAQGADSILQDMLSQTPR